MLLNEKSKIEELEGARQTHASALYDQLRTDIVSCRILPGEKLQMERLKLSYGVGASPIREALNRLVSEGLVTQIDQRGFRAAPVEPAELEDVTRARCWIGAAAFAESIRSGDTEWEERILLSFHRWERELKNSSGNAAEFTPRIHKLHGDFHRALLSACGSSWMLNFWDAAFDFSQRYQVISLRQGIKSERNPAIEHRGLMEAALDRDLERALDLHEKHLRLTAELVHRITKSAALDGQADGAD